MKKILDKSEFHKKLYVKIMDAMKICDEGNVIDMRLFINENNLCDGEYTIFEIDNLYDKVKDCRVWFIDFYENIKGDNRAEYIDVTLFSDEFKTDLSPLFDNFDACYEIATSAETRVRQSIVDIVSAIQKTDGVDYIKFTDETTYPRFYDETIDEWECIVGASVVNNVLYFTTDSTFDSTSWFKWEHYGRFDYNDFVYILKYFS